MLKEASSKIMMTVSLAITLCEVMNTGATEFF